MFAFEILTIRYILQLILVNGWLDSTPVAEVQIVSNLFRATQLPLLETLAGPDSGAYSNEADVLETHYQTTFFGPNYPRLSAIKTAHDPDDLFIVRAGVGSERWDEWGLCRV